MSLIQSVDPEFRVCQIGLDTLAELQLQAEDHGWGTRWTSIDALRTQVKDAPILLQPFMRQKRAGGIIVYRCLILFASAENDAAGGVATIDVDPEKCESLDRVDRDPDVRVVLARIFALASGGISMITKA
jgi:hypothetical protein